MSLSQTYPLSDHQVDFYRQEGCLTLRNVISKAELQPYLEAADAVVEEGRDDYDEDRHDVIQEVLIQLMNVWQQDDRLAELVTSQRLGRLAADLMSVEDARIYHDQIFYKPPGGDPTPWHQDEYYWPFDTPNTISIWIPLEDCPAEAGSLEYARGSHRYGQFGESGISRESDSSFRRLIQERGFEVNPAMDLSAGDALFHAGWLLHRAVANRTPEPRKNLCIIYYGVGTTVNQPQNEDQAKDIRRWFPEREPGELADNDELHPVVS